MTEMAYTFLDDFKVALAQQIFPGGPDTVTDDLKSECDNSLTATHFLLLTRERHELVEMIKELFAVAGGYCDCEVLFNVKTLSDVEEEMRSDPAFKYTFDDPRDEVGDT